MSIVDSASQQIRLWKLAESTLQASRVDYVSQQSQLGILLRPKNSFLVIPLLGVSDTPLVPPGSDRVKVTLLATLRLWKLEESTLEASRVNSGHFSVLQKQKPSVAGQQSQLYQLTESTLLACRVESAIFQSRLFQLPESQSSQQSHLNPIGPGWDQGVSDTTNNGISKKLFFGRNIMPI